MLGGRPRRRFVVIAALAALFVVLTAPLSRAQPILLSISPEKGPVGASVTITGVGFTGANSVLFGTVPATTFTIDSDEQITATVPQGAVTAPVEVDSPDGNATSLDPFVVQPNVLVVITDDQRWDTLSYMPNVESELVDHGLAALVLRRRSTVADRGKVSGRWGRVGACRSTCPTWTCRV